jgi:PIN like domain
LPSKSSPSPPEFTFFTDRDLGNEVPDALAAAGYAVERHRDHFRDDALDVDIFLGVSKHPAWMMLTKDKRQRARPDERDMVMRAGVPLFIFVGTGMTHPEIAQAIVFSAPAILHFRERKPPPFIAKIYRPEWRTNHRRVPRIEMSLTHSAWLAQGRA